MDDLTLCCIAKDENVFLGEWVAYHALRGVERLIVCDNGSRVPLAETLAPLTGRLRLRGRGHARSGTAARRLRPLPGGLWSGHVLARVHRRGRVFAALRDGRPARAFDRLRGRGGPGRQLGHVRLLCAVILAAIGRVV